ncbi:HAD family hydrolase, partial [Planococcus sp. SIMBA_160]
MYTSDAQIGQPDAEWMKRLDAQGFSDAKIEDILQTVREKGITLKAQTQLGSSGYKKNFYYQEQDERTDLHHLSFIQTLAKERGVAVNINKCNPLAGDPADCYDVDFLPVGTGKDEIVR